MAAAPAEAVLLLPPRPSPAPESFVPDLDGARWGPAQRRALTFAHLASSIEVDALLFAEASAERRGLQLTTPRTTPTAPPLSPPAPPSPPALPPTSPPSFPPLLPPPSLPPLLPPTLPPPSPPPFPPPVPSPPLCLRCISWWETWWFASWIWALSLLLLLFCVLAIFVCVILRRMHEQLGACAQRIPCRSIDPVEPVESLRRVEYAPRVEGPDQGFRDVGSYPYEPYPVTLPRPPTPTAPPPACVASCYSDHAVAEPTPSWPPPAQPAGFRV